MASAVSPGPRRWSKSFEHHVQRAEVRGIGVQNQRLAGDPHRVLHARRVVRERSIRAMTSLRALHGRRVGQLHVQQQVSLVLLGNEARRRVGEFPVGQNSRPP